MSLSLGIICIAAGLFAVGIACCKPAPGKKNLRIRLFILGPAIIVIGIMIITGFI